MPNVNLLEVYKQTDPENDAIVGMIEENMSAHPELMRGDTKIISGTSFKSLVRTTLPATGFRSLNEGVATANAVYEQRESTCYLCDASSEIDKAMGQVSDESVEQLLANEIDAKIESYMRNLASQFYYGTASTLGVASGAASAAKGYVGLADIYDTTNMEVDAAGVSAAYTSVWLVKFGAKYVQWLAGTDGMLNVGETTEERLTDGSGNPYDGLRKPVTFWVGLHAPNPRNSIVRIKKLDTAATLTDTLIDQAIEKFPGGVQPDVILMTRRSLRQLKNSRTATTTSGQVAEWPTDIQGIAGVNIPIMTTDAISQVETA